jgi:hypothetical protein
MTNSLSVIYVFICVCARMYATPVHFMYEWIYLLCIYVCVNVLRMYVFKFVVLKLNRAYVFVCGFVCE